ncbi:transcriptional regulator BetI [Alloyangia pacifica]|uniref:HTH-type transcriptional regulator BetI n=1 Tax=Alloyangia pacifica TaxID=311180 RepID=A0A2U8HHQ4_9RHOB|nr:MULTISPECIES: transcriptional regulator BetI [Roseobacteraceae]AWI85467.1 transcriptional regulator BetI [Alloyangia pacifica]NDV52576.1 transcriptional regulator BetI [Salipiger sp. PrR003]NDW34157.1 transcriptional regulator BetI [Salipiger sp. PrR007]
MARKSEEERRRDLIAATIREIGASGTLNVTTSQIAKRAGVSPGLAFHYFHDKDTLFLAAMRSILSDYKADVTRALASAITPEDRVNAIVQASFGMGSFRREAISAWVNFYALALRSEEARRLLYLYQRRLHSNLVYALRPRIGERAPDVARRIGGLIDGLYLRYALDTKMLRPPEEAVGAVDGSEGAQHVLRAIAAECTEVHENDDISMADADPAPMAPLAGPQE